VTNFLQLTADGAIAGTAYALLGVAFGIILSVTRRFHFAFTVTYTISAYIASVASLGWGLPFWLAMVVGACVGGVIGILCEVLVYRPLAPRAGANVLLGIFVASLGLSIAGENIIGLIWIDTASRAIGGFTNRGLGFGGVTISTLSITMMITSWLLILALALVLRLTKLGRMIRAVRANPEMSLVVGVDAKTIFLVVFAIGSFLGGIAAVFQATETAATPDMGFDPLFYAFTVAFLAGLSAEPVAIGLVGLGIGLVESWSNLFMDESWTQLVVFGILFVYIALRPVQLRGLLQRIPTPARAETAAR
jgi:branched-subunit amino acid ABC-type transport system permease component